MAPAVLTGPVPGGAPPLLLLLLFSSPSARSIFKQVLSSFLIVRILLFSFHRTVLFHPCCCFISHFNTSIIPSGSLALLFCFHYIYLFWCIPFVAVFFHVCKHQFLYNLLIETNISVPAIGLLSLGLIELTWCFIVYITPCYASL